MSGEMKALPRERYRREGGKVVVEVAIGQVQQLFNARDPAPFRDRDLDDDFARYVLSSVQEFAVKTPMKMRIVIRDESRDTVDPTVVREAIRAQFFYEARLSHQLLRKRLRVGRLFLVVGLMTLMACLSLSALLESMTVASRLRSIASEGLIIIGWVAMWRPVEVILYDWWPLREQRLYFEKIAQMDVEIICSESARAWEPQRGASMNSTEREQTKVSSARLRKALERWESEGGQVATPSEPQERPRQIPRAQSEKNVIQSSV
jgi:hypothetical protein